MGEMEVKGREEKREAVSLMKIKARDQGRERLDG